MKVTIEFKDINEYLEFENMNEYLGFNEKTAQEGQVQEQFIDIMIDDTLVAKNVLNHLREMQIKNGLDILASKILL